jgi:hypothetical protein
MNISGTTESTFHLNFLELRSLQIQARQGDSNSAKRIADYYYFSKKDMKLGLFWAEEALFLGDPDAYVLIQNVLDKRGMESYRELIQRTNSFKENVVIKMVDDSKNNTAIP